MKIGGNDILSRTEHPNLDDVRSRPFLKWAGGKRTLIPEIVKRIPKFFNDYWEPFLGGGAVFFALDNLIRSANLSDVNSELVLTYQVVRNDPVALISYLQEHAKRHSKPHYLQVRKQSISNNPVEVAARFIYLNKTCFNGLYRVNKSGQFNVPMGTYRNPTICDAENLCAVSEVLQKANMRLGDFSKIRPRAADFIYADPPYDGAFSSYDSSGFTEDDQKRLRDIAIEWHNTGAFIMISNADSPLIQELYSRQPFALHSVTAPRNINSNANGRGPVAELLITTYE